MEFNVFLEQLPKIKNLPLPGLSAHAKMVPPLRRRDLEHMTVPEQAKRAGVMALCYPNESGNTMLLLILRKTYKGVHANQIGFPGGKVEMDDRHIQDTALRETFEEVGVPVNEIRLVRELSDVYIPPSNFLVTPFLGWCAAEPRFIIQESEVEALVKVPLTEFLAVESVQERELSTSYANTMKVPAFILQDHVVWGATAMMLSEIRDLWFRAQ
ncbi:NUDIX hydrolase [Sediminicola luteus]|uniref:Coenzyme A pyrophosphatase n=1 Tax=Sediminicola luteus TaxID=319238 RepID=A0A2A4GAN9_9FLAO|nr:CoA pyrophosphatase [Sediminicola luteus]PCE65040.1 coenzyme A pyrophosphatase [Sediminicola luteus]